MFVHKTYFFFINNTATTEITTLSLHDVLPICIECWIVTSRMGFGKEPSPTWNDDLFEAAREIGIPKNQIHFC